MRKAMTRGSAEDQVRKHRDRVKGAWKQISKPRRRVDESYDPNIATALRHGTWMDEATFKRMYQGKGGKTKHLLVTLLWHMGRRLHAATG